MLRKIKLYGKLAKFIGHRTLEADVATAAEAARFLVANWPELEKHMADQHYRVSLGSYDLSEDELHDPAGRQVIKIAPVVGGAGAVGKIIAGIALIALSFIPGIGALAVSLMITVGSSLVLGGVAQLLSPVPRTPTGADSEQDPQKSYSFSGIQNTSRAGVPVPIVYGETLVGSVVISAGIDTVQVTDSVSAGQSPGELAFQAMFKQA
jgi:predicted phage tail protein